MIKLKVEGMTCGHCESAVKESLATVPGVEAVVAVSAETGEAVVQGDPDLANLIAAVKEAGYEATAAP